ncbi:MAG: ATPase [Anaerolineae bacterium]|nr:ATPase [Anaerolineae bacterium]
MEYQSRISTGIRGLDTMLNGGYLPQTANLVEGAPGCGKTTLGMQFIHEGAYHRGEPGLILTFEQFPQQYYRDAANFGWNFRELERKNLLRVVMSSPEVTKIDMESIGGMVTHTLREIKAKRILIDSISLFEQLGTGSVELRDLVYSFINALKRQGLTILLTRESSCLLGEDTNTQNDSNIHFVVDSYTMLRYVEIESAIRRAIIVLKMRGSAHDTHIRQFDIDSHGVTVSQPFEGQEGILSGTPKRMTESFIKAFVRK